MTEVIEEPLIDITLPDPAPCIAVKKKDNIELKVRLDVDLAAKYVLDNIPQIVTLRDTGEMWICIEGKYRPYANTFIEQVLEAAFGGFKSDEYPGKILLDNNYTITEIITKIKRKTYVDRSNFEVLQANYQPAKFEEIRVIHCDCHIKQQ